MISALLGELKVHLEKAENKTNPIDGLPALLVASDLAHLLGGLKFVNCMSGKDRTGYVGDARAVQTVDEESRDFW